MVQVIFAKVQEDRTVMQRWLLAEAAKASGAGRCLVVLVRDPAMAQRVDEQLWALDEESFVPHVIESPTACGLASVLIRVGHQIPQQSHLALNLSGQAAQWPEGWSGTVCDLVWTVNPQQLEEGRAKWAAYKAREGITLAVKQSLDFSLDGVQ